MFVWRKAPIRNTAQDAPQYSPSGECPRNAEPGCQFRNSFNCQRISKAPLTDDLGITSHSGNSFPANVQVPFEVATGKSFAKRQVDAVYRQKAERVQRQQKEREQKPIAFFPAIKEAEDLSLSSFKIPCSVKLKLLAHYAT